MQNYILQILLSLSTLLGVSSEPPRQADWQVIQAWTRGAKSSLIFEAQSNEVVESCRKNPSFKIQFPRIVHGVHIVKADGRIVFQSGDETFEKATPFYDAPIVPCEIFENAKLLNWTVHSYTHYFARFTKYPEVTDRTLWSTFLNNYINIIAVSILLFLSLMTFYFFRKKISNDLTYSIIGGAVFSAIFCMMCTSTSFNIPLSMLVAHKIADFCIFSSFGFYFFYFYKFRFLSLRSLTLILIGLTAGNAIILSSQGGDTIQFGTTSNLIVSVIALVTLLLGTLKAIYKERNSSDWKTKKVTFYLSLISVLVFMITGTSDIIFTLGVIDTYLFTQVSQIMVFIVIATIANQQIENTYTERDELFANLEKKVEEKTHDLSVALDRVKVSQKEIKNILDHLGEGYFVINSDINIRDEYSQKFAEFFPECRSSKNILEILPLELNQKDTFQEWLNYLFVDKIDFYAIEDLAIKSLSDNGKYYEMKFKPLYSELEDINGIIGICSDVTLERNLNLQLNQEINTSKRILNIVKNNQSFLRYVTKFEEQLTVLKEWMRTVSVGEHNVSKDELNEFASQLHTLKGLTGFYYLEELQLTIQNLESLIKHYDKTANREIESLIEKTESEFVQFKADHGFIFQFLKQKDTLHNRQKRLDEILKENFEDLCLKESTQLGKQVNLTVGNTDVKIDEFIYADWVQSLVHLFRNSIDHGIEYPSERELQGKTAFGHIKIEFEVQNKNTKDQLIKMTVKDDGKGISPSVLRAKLVEKKVYSKEEVDTLSDYEILQAIFKANFSTRDTVTLLSGQGLGLYATFSESTKLGGKLFVESEVGHWTQFTFLIPMIG